MSDGRVIIDIGADQSGFDKAVAGLGKSAERQLSGLSASFGKAGDALTRYVTLPFMAAAAATVTFGVKTAASFEQTAISFETMLGSAEAGQRFFDDLKEFAARTPFELPGLLESSKKLLAFGFAASDIIPTLTSVGDAAAALGVGTEGLDRMVTALGQMKAKGKVSAEEMLQLAEAGVPAWDALAKKLGVTVPEAMKKVERGAVSAEMGISALTEAMDARFGGMMLRQSQTLEGLFSTFKDVFSIKLGEAFQANLEPMKDVLIELTDTMGPFIDAVVPALIAAIEAIMPALEGATGLLQQFSDASPEVQEGILKVIGALVLLGPALKVTSVGMSALASAQKLLGGASLVSSLGNWGAALKIVAGNMGAPIGQLAALGTQTAVTSAGFVALAGAAGYAIGTLISNIPAVKQTADALAQAAGEADDFGEYIKAAGERQKTWVDYLFPSVSATQNLAGALGFLSGELEDVATLQESYNLQLDESGAPTAESIEALRRLNEARRVEAETTAAATGELAAYNDKLNEVKNEQNSAERADIALERAKMRLVDAQKAYEDVLKEHPATSREAQEAALDLRDAELDVEDAALRVEAAQSTLNEKLAAFPRPNDRDLNAWVTYYQKIGDKAGYAAAQANLALGAMTGGKVKGGGGTLQIPLGSGGGEFTGPTSGYLAMLHGREWVFPAGDLAAFEKFMPDLLASLPGQTAPVGGAVSTRGASAVAGGGMDVNINGELPMGYVDMVFALRDWKAGLVS